MPFIDVRVTVGPVIGKVSSTSAVVLLEITLTAYVTCYAIPVSIVTPFQVPQNNVV